MVKSRERTAIPPAQPHLAAYSLSQPRGGAELLVTQIRNVSPFVYGTMAIVFFSVEIDDEDVDRENRQVEFEILEPEMADTFQIDRGGVLSARKALDADQVR